MSDSFADLWNSSSPTTSSKPAQKLGSSSNHAGANAPYKPKVDAFSILAASSRSTSRSITPNASSKVITSSPSTTNGSLKPANAGLDVFGDLLSDNLGSVLPENTANMTIAERAAKAEQDKRNKALNSYATQFNPTPYSSSPWSGLDSLGTSKSTSTSVSLPTVEDDWFDAGITVQSPLPEPPLSDPYTLLLGGDLGLPRKEASKPSASSSGPRKEAIWDLEDFASPHASSSVSPQLSSRPNSPDHDFDFGNREDNLLGMGNNQDESNILGALAKPVGSNPSALSSPFHRRKESPTSRLRTSSPPPHIIGQIVEMGFSPQQARIALAATDTGVDVQVALETLLVNGAGSGSRKGNSRRHSPPPSLRSSANESDSTLDNRPPTTRAHASSQKFPHQQQDLEESSSGIQEQADRIIAQASELGLNVFNRANAFWSAGKEKVQKAYVEQRAAAIAKSPQNDRTSAGGRQTMTAPAVKPRPSTNAPIAPSSTLPTRQTASTSTAAIAISATHKSSGTEKIKLGQYTDLTSIPIAPASTLRARKTISASAAAIATSAKHKSAGAEKFKLGQYADAESSYSLAIACLPSKHLLLVPLFNNRALVRLKIGEYTKSIEDSSQVINIIGGDFAPGRELPVEKEEDGKGVDLGDGLMKAWKRRAEAYEGKEKWGDARRDWEAVAGSAWANAKLRTEGVNGAGRCRKMMSDGADTTRQQQGSRSQVKPKLTSPVKASPSLVPGAISTSAAAENFRKATAQAEAEDLARHSLKDAVDAKLQAWKGGKENNIRALIASLDTLLWDDLGWESVGMKDLITDKQVKIRYTKAIARLHPDKLNTSHISLENRMIANGVFGTLNDAWNAFQQK